MTEGWQCHGVAIVVKLEQCHSRLGFFPHEQRKGKLVTNYFTKWPGSCQGHLLKYRCRSICMIYIINIVFEFRSCCWILWQDSVPTVNVGVNHLNRSSACPPSAISPLMSVCKIAIVVGVSHARQYLTKIYVGKHGTASLANYFASWIVKTSLLLMSKMWHQVILV